MLFPASDKPGSLEVAFLDEEIKVLDRAVIQSRGDLLVDVVLDRSSGVIHVSEHVLVDNLQLVCLEVVPDFGVISTLSGGLLGRVQFGLVALVKLDPHAVVGSRELASSNVVVEDGSAPKVLERPRLFQF